MPNSETPHPDTSEGSPRPRVLSRTVLHRGAKFNFEDVLVATDSDPSGGVHRQVVRHPGSVVIVPLLEREAREPELILIYNQRVPIERSIYELPAGTRETGEDAAACAARELIEETGYQAASVEPLCSFYTSPGMTDEWMQAFVARGLTFVGQDLEADERMTVHPTPVSTVMDMIRSGEIRDCKTIAGVLRWQMTDRR